MTAGLPGSGLFYTLRADGGGGRPGQGARRARRGPGLWARLTMPAAERAFLEGLKALSDGADAAALTALERAATLPDAAWAAGMLRLSRGDVAAARAHLTRALDGIARLGTLYRKHDVMLRVDLPITPEIDAHVWPRERGTRLALVEIAQATGDRGAALAHFEALLALEPGDPVVVLSFAELVLESGADRAAAERVLALTEGTPNETPVDTAILLYRARALAALDMTEAAIATLTLANHRRRDRPPALLRQIRYDRAVRYETVGRRADARREFERLFAEDPDLGDLRARLGLGAG